MRKTARQRRDEEKARCWCGTDNESHAPWCALAPITTESLRYSAVTGCNSKRSDYSTWIHKPDEPDQAYLQLLAQLRGPRVEHEQEICNYREWKEPCERCGEQTLVITISQGQKVRQIDLCECQIPPDQLVKNRLLEAEWDYRDRVKARREQTRRVQIDQNARLRDRSAECRGVMNQQFPGMGCKDPEQAFEFCAGCEWKRKKRPAKPREKAQQKD